MSAGVRTAEGLVLMYDPYEEPYPTEWTEICEI